MKRLKRSSLLAFLLSSSLLASVQEVKLGWDPNTEANIAGYRVYRGEDGGLLLQIGSVASPGYIDRNVVAGRLYRYSVRAFNIDAAESGLSNIVDVMPVAPQTDAPGELLTAPASVTTRCSDDGHVVDVSWSPVPGADFYYVHLDNTANNVPGGHWVVDDSDTDLDEYPYTFLSAAVQPGADYVTRVRGGRGAEAGSITTGSFRCLKPDTTPPARPILSLQ